MTERSEGQIQLDLPQIQMDGLCRDRVVESRQRARDERTSSLEGIKRFANFPSSEEDYDEMLYDDFDTWEHILDRVKGPKEIQNLWNVCDMFRHLLRGRYIETRLVDIVKMIIDKSPNYLLPVDPPENENERNELQSTFLNLRLVSKLCKASLEDLFATGTLDQIYLPFRTLVKLENITVDLKEDPSRSRVDSFFPGRILVSECILDSSSVIDFTPFHDGVTRLLKLVGHRVKFFTYVTYQWMWRKIYNCLREWVVLMPNLEKLSLKCGKYMRAPGWPKLEEIPPFPVCPSLMMFQEGWETLPAPYVHRILDACTGVRNLHLAEVDNAREHSPLMLSGHDLEKLRMSPHPEFLSHHFPWKLKKLILAHPSKRDKENKIMIPSSKLFPFLQLFEETLQHLHIWIDVTYSSSAEGQYLHLANLKVLKWNQHDSFTDISFLLHTSRLETLQIMFDLSSIRGIAAEEAKRCNVCFRGIAVEEGKGSFMGKSIWEVFPNLRVVRLEREQLFFPTEIVSLRRH